MKKNKKQKLTYASVGLGIILLLPFVLPQLQLLYTPATTPIATSEQLLTVASWNVENLFDAEDDPDNPGDDEFTPKSWTRWTAARYKMKLQHLAEVIAAMRPDIICLAEIENRRVLSDLVQVLKDRYQWHMPVILHRDGPDMRGIDVAMLARWEPVATQWLTPLPVQREILVATFEPYGRPVTVICNHWKSNLGNAEDNFMTRSTEALCVRQWVETKLSESPTSAIIVTGDFNDDIDSHIMMEIAGFSLYDGTMASSSNGILLNLSGMLTGDKRGTYFYTKAQIWHSFDSASVTPGMLPDAQNSSPWQVITNSYAPFALPQQRDEYGRPIPFRRVRKKFPDGIVRTTNYNGYADHFPIRMQLQ